MSGILKVFSAFILSSSLIYAQQIEYQVIEIPIQYSSDKILINNEGVVQNNRWIWNNGVITELPVVPFDDFLNIAGLNDSSTVLGTAHNMYSNNDTTYWLTKAYRYDGGPYLTSLGLPAGFIDTLTGTEARAINNLGVSIIKVNGTNYTFNNGWYLMNLSTGDEVYCLNDYNNFAGTHYSPGFDNAFVVLNGVYTNFGSQMFGDSYAYDINNTNQVVGDGQTSSPFYEAFLYDNYTLHPLGFISGGSFRHAYSINDEGVIAGSVLDSNYQTLAVIWRDYIIKDLNTLISPDSGWVLRIARDINNSGEIVGLGTRYGTGRIFLLKPNYIHILSPQSNQLFIAGEKDTIKWEIGGEIQTVKIEYATDEVSVYELIDEVPAEPGEYVWDVPADLLSTKMQIKISDANAEETYGESDLFRSKPYKITRLDQDGDYIAYNIHTDCWGFGNSRAEMWPSSYWYGRFDYNTGTDPYTNKVYDQEQGDSTFYNAFAYDFPDWESFVRAYSTEVCYRSTANGIYNRSALLRWGAKKREWRGSCFGIAAANALVFWKRDEFQAKYRNFPAFTNPIEVTSDTNVIPVIAELFAHNFGDPTQWRRDLIWSNTTVNQTLHEIKDMLSKDDTPIRTLSMWNNSDIRQAHTVNPYLLEKERVNDGIYDLYVWDNSYPYITYAIITIDTTAFSNKGRFDPVYGWNGWGGDKYFVLEVPSDAYLNNAIIPYVSSKDQSRLFSSSTFEIDVTDNQDIIITDSTGSRTGYSNDIVLNEIPDGRPLLFTNPGGSPPYGYSLRAGDYSIVLNNFRSDTANVYFFSQNNTFAYKRVDAANTEIDKLFFDGGLSAVNPDNQAKDIKLLCLTDDTTNAEDKMIIIRSLDLQQNDSVKIEPENGNNFRLTGWGTAKNYGLGLEYASEQQEQFFANPNIQLPGNTAHIFVPNWTDLYNNPLMILVDEGNNGTIDDTLFIENQLTSVGEGQGSILPDEYNLEQNYPNPFNNSTTIKYSIPKEGLVTIKVYNIIAEEVATLVDEVRKPGNYELQFNAGSLPSGVYIYRLISGEFVSTRKMVLLK